jgi:quercetin dioxygenase-like cupin family protein
MKKSPFSIVSLVAMALAGISLVRAADMSQPMQPEEMKWSAVPPVLPAGAKITVLAGDPSTQGFVSLRLKMPPGYRILPHSHPTDEHVTVISGTFAIGMGDRLDKAQSKTLKPGGYAVAPANMHHFAWTKTGAVVQVDMIGPFQITYVNPADDPSKK